MYLLNLFSLFRFIGGQPRKDKRKKTQDVFWKTSGLFWQTLSLPEKSALCRNIYNTISLNPEFFFVVNLRKKPLIFSKINSGFSAKLVTPPLDVDVISEDVLASV